MTFRQANLQDFDTCWRLIDAARWKMMADGRHQWTAEYPSRELIIADIKSGEAYVLTDEDDVKTYGVVTQNGESAYEQCMAEWLTEGDYMVIHRLAVSPNARGKGLAKQFFQGVEAMCRQQNIHSIKVDTNHDNREMRGLLQRLGFVECGKIDYGPRGMRLAFERVL
ncbi:GNAT family N-acetyltransferase [Segatella maculosa]|uniref:GNAT family N-acetyltransferase n=1 Tax=Segatella maculosa TaxID=439703 RepID=UPI00035CE088|nr:GNAT family N-acetyltransferase [Segatella maculosa]